MLNLLAYRDYIPVLDAGIAIDTFADGSGMRNATWRAHILRPGAPCMSCIGQLDLGAVTADQTGALDDPSYIAAGIAATDTADQDASAPASANVALLSISVTASVLRTCWERVVGVPAGEPGPSG